MDKGYDFSKGKRYSFMLALRLSKIVHDLCKDVPHDIGIKLAQEVTAFKCKCDCQRCDGWKELQKRIDQCRKLPNKHMNDIGDLLSSIRGTFSFCPYCGNESKVIPMGGVENG